MQLRRTDTWISRQLQVLRIEYSTALSTPRVARKTAPRCKHLVGWGPLISWISPVMVTWQVRSSKHHCPFDSIITGSFLMTTLFLKLTLSPKWHDLVTWITRLVLSSPTPLFLSVSVIWLTWHCHMCDIRTETMTMLDSFCSTTILSLCRLFILSYFVRHCLVAISTIQAYQADLSTWSQFVPG